MSENHHYLPQFYLKGFLDDNIKKMYYCNKQHNTFKNASPAGIFYEKNANTIDFGEYGTIEYEKDFSWKGIVAMQRLFLI